MIYSKNSTSVQEQIALLQARGLIITNIAEAEHALSNISYYRLTGYWWPMQRDKVTHEFKVNSKFEDVIALYNFDRELRLLIFDIIERIEIALRTKLVHHLSQEFNPWWFQDTGLFIDPRELIKTLNPISDEIDRSKDTFIRDHIKRYNTDTRFPPAWKTLEVATFGSLSRLYGNLKPTIKSKDAIAAEFKTVNHTYLPSWLQSIAQIRNICAHHGRLWNKNLPGRPKLMPKPPVPWLLNVPTASQHHMLYIHMCCMKYLLDVISPGHSVMPKLVESFKKYPNVDMNALGFPAAWQNEPLWMV